MPLYECELCNYSSKIKTQFKRHCDTKKHQLKYLNSKSKINEKDKHNSKKDNCVAILNNIQSDMIEPSKLDYVIDDYKDDIELPNYIKVLPSNNNKQCIKHENEISFIEVKTKTQKKLLECTLCGRLLSTKGHLTRHMKTYCPALKTKKETNILKDILEEQQQQFADERATLYKQIEKLLDKVGNTTNIQSNIKNTITLNSYGNENMSHITDQLKTKLVKLPYVMIPKLIEAVHFNDKHPENKNIALTNSRDNKIKVFSDNKWIYRDKEETINDLVDGKYYILDTHFDEVNDSLQSDYKSNFVKFKEYFSSEDKEFCNKLKRKCEMVLLNNR
jgi:hypothetical protein